MISREIAAKIYNCHQEIASTEYIQAEFGKWFATPKEEDKLNPNRSSMPIRYRQVSLMFMQPDGRYEQYALSDTLAASLVTAHLAILQEQLEKLNQQALMEGAA